MSRDRRHEIATKKIVLEIPGVDALVVQRDVPYALVDGDRLTMDIYRPAGPESAGLTTPAVLFVTGYGDEGMRKAVGCNAKDMASYVTWAQLMATSGLVAITYTNWNPVTDVHEVLRYVRAHRDLGIDGERVGLWACSGNVPTALSVLMEPRSCVRCAALLYGYLLDVDGTTSVAEAATIFRFANPCAWAIARRPAGGCAAVGRTSRERRDAAPERHDRSLPGQGPRAQPPCHSDESPHRPSRLRHRRQHRRLSGGDQADR